MQRHSFLAGLALAALCFFARGAGAQCWTEQALLTPAGGGSNDRYGWSLAVSGDTAVVGAYATGVNAAGRAYVLERNAGGAGAWGEVKKLKASNSNPALFFGWDVAIDGDTLVVSGPEDPNANVVGAAYVFERDLGGPGNWGEVKLLVPSVVLPDDYYGRSVAIAGDTIVVGAEFTSALAQLAGAAYVFERDLGGADSWGLARTISMPAGLILGSSVAISGDTLAASAVGDQTFGLGSGAAFLFERDLGGPGNWGQAAKVLAADGFAGDQFGRSLSIDGDTLVVGACYADHDGDEDSGAAYVFERDLGGPGAWSQARKLTASDGAPDDFFSEIFGSGVAVSGDAIAVGASGNDDFGASSGSVYVYQRDLGGAGGWGQTKKLLPSVGAKFEAFGFAVDVDGDTLFAGAPSGQGRARVFEASAAGAAVYCTAGTSAVGCEAFLTACGTPSASAASGFVLQAGNTNGFKDAIVFFGTSGRQALPWGAGSFQCVQPPLQRTGVLNGTGNGAPGWCDGTFALDLNAYWCASCPKPQHNPGAGAAVQAQLWIVDPLTAPKGSVTSNAIEFTLAP